MRWICARAKIGSEMAICAGLEAETLCPSYVTTVRSGRKESRIHRAVFAGYFFADGSGLHEILGTHNVYGAISSADGPKTVPESVIHDLRARIAQDAFAPLLGQSVGKRKRFQNGAAIILESGLFQGLTMLVEKDLGPVIRGTIAGCGHLYEVPESSLEP